jgi:hypothetical protein
MTKTSIMSFDCHNRSIGRFFNRLDTLLKEFVVRITSAARKCRLSVVRNKLPIPLTVSKTLPSFVSHKENDLEVTYEYLGQYRHDGKIWCMNIFAKNDEDAKARAAKLGEFELLGRLCERGEI